MAEATSIPRRTDLIRQIEASSRWSIYSVVIQFALIAIILPWLDWKKIVAQPIITTVIICGAAGPMLLSLMKMSVQKKKRIQDLREDAKFGQYDKHRLYSLYQDTLRRLSLPDEQLPVYIVADRSLNAMAMHSGLGSLFKSLNGLYLHRQVLHKLEPEEIQDILGHELGHYYRNYIAGDRFRIAPILLSVLGAIGIAQLVDLDNFWIAYIGMAFVWWLVWKWSGIFYAINAKGIEFLCDDFGAQVHGVITSIQGLLKLGVASEAEYAIMHHAITTTKNKSLSKREIVETIFASIPYGHVSTDEIEAEIQRALRKKAGEKNATISGFIRYAWQSDSDSEVDEEIQKRMKKWSKLQNQPRLDWESTLPDRTKIQFDERSIREFIELIENNESVNLFRLPDEHDQTDGVHPPLKERILFLWYNREEIESGKKLFR